MQFLRTEVTDNEIQKMIAMTRKATQRFDEGIITRRLLCLRLLQNMILTEIVYFEKSNISNNTCKKIFKETVNKEIPGFFNILFLKPIDLLDELKTTLNSPKSSYILTV